MSGILGIWNLDGRPVDPAVLAKLGAPLAHRGPDGEGHWIEGPVGLACRLFRVTPEAATETQPLVHACGAVLVFDGRLDNREELLADLKSRAGLSRASPDPALVLAAYDAYRDRFCEKLAGDFALGLYDARRHQMILARDGIGIRPLYYSQTGNTFLFASEIKAILAHPEVSARPDKDAVASLIINSFFGGSPQETFFEGVSRPAPGQMVVITPQGVVQRRYWDFDIARRVRFGSFPEYVEAFRHYFEQSVRRRLRSAYPVAVSVSGGLDSSAIFCLAETLRRREPGLPPMIGVSQSSEPGSESYEEEYQREIEKYYGLALHRLPLTAPGPLKGIREEVWHMETPMVDERWHNTSAFWQTAHDLGARVLLTGHWGDNVLFNQGYLIDLFRRFAWGQVSVHLGKFGSWLSADSKWFRQTFFRDLVRHHVPEALVPLLRRLRNKVTPRTPDRSWYAKPFRERASRDAPGQPSLAGPFATAHAWSLYREVRRGLNNVCMEWNNKSASLHGLEIAFPYLDRDLISFLLAIPGEVQTWKGVPKALLREALPGVLPKAIAERRSKAGCTDLINTSMERDHAEVVHYLQDGMAVQLGYVDEAVLRQELGQLTGRVRGPGCVVAWRLSYLLGLEMWLRVFFGEQSNQKEKTHVVASA
jgi:asparagine synthase (glutamine-hydrolysing)